jgi:superfamily II DNA or RNA helicase
MFIYLVSSAYTDTHGQKKLGLTIHPVHRMRQYNIGDAPDIGLEKKYDALWLVNATTKHQLKYIENIVHTHFQSQRNRRRNGSPTEWFNVTLEQVRDFISRQGFFLREFTLDEVREITKKAEREPLESETQEIEEEVSLIREEVENLPETLKQKFFNAFLPGKIPRRIQDELWDIFEKICNDDLLLATIYKGIVQWPTGTGKTIAMLLIFVLAKERSVRLGKIYRGLLVSPKNDIFNTISSEFNKLSEFGITLYDGSNGRLSGLSVPTNQHILVMACPQSLLIDATGMKNLPHMTHVHYDEVHRITGELYFQLLKEMLVKWDTQFLTGTSATPKTSSQSQQKKILELFGDPLNILHKCDIDEAVREGWIAKPRFIVNITEKHDVTSHVNAFIQSIKNTIQLKKYKGLWVGGKVLAYLPDKDSAILASRIALKEMPEAKIYTAIDGERTDKEFVKAKADGSIQILFACDRYREGSDIKGIDMACVLVGDSISAHILIQILGRSLRLDYPDKEGWCLILHPNSDNKSEEDVLDGIILNIMEIIKESNTPYDKKNITQIVENYFGDVIIDGKTISLKETIERVQNAYIREEYKKRTPKEKYELIRAINKEMNIQSKDEYFERGNEHSRFISDPKSYFKECWNSWYDFLGVDCSLFPQTKADWVRVWKEREFIDWEDYKQKRDESLPENPSELYDDFTNCDKEVGVEEEHVW